jgi:MarR family transcriptional regulator, organic hydroperoxide resistance regulator
VSEPAGPGRQGGFLVSKVHQTSGRIFARKLREHGIDEINPAQGRILFVLWKKDGIPIGELAAGTGLDKSTLTSMLDRLEAAGQLVREPCPEDRRKTVIRLTDRNRAMFAAYESVSAEMIELYYRGIPEAEIDAFERTLERILGNLEEATRKAT